jgi:hypothetical protein
MEMKDWILTNCQDVPKVIACLGDSDGFVRRSALDAIGKLVEYGE